MTGWRHHLIAALALLLGACTRTPDPADDSRMNYRYPADLKVSCPTGSLSAIPAEDGQRINAAQFSYQVRTPANYDARFAHPLLVVYAPAGASAGQTERLMKLTATATGHGFIVTYVDHRPMSKRNVLGLGGVSRSVAEHWCVDARQVFHAGHSDGGTVAAALALLPQASAGVQGIAVSAAGFQKQDLEEMHCRAPIPVMIMHGSQDKLFPGWGREAAQWWAQCNGCKAPVHDPDKSGCVEYSACAPGNPVLYCEGAQTHSEWAGLQGRIVDFLLGRPTTGR